MKYSITLVIILAIILFIIDFDNSYETLIHYWLPLIGILITGMLVYSLKERLKVLTYPLLGLFAVIIISAPVIFLVYNGKELYDDLGLGFIIVLIINILIAFAFIKDKMN